MKQYSAKYDLIFQQSMCTENNQDILKWFLEHLLETDIKNLKVLSPVLPISTLYERKKTVDVLVETDEGRINIEVNNTYYKALNKRNFGYLGAAYNASMKSSKDINKMPHFMQINLTWNLTREFANDPILVYEVLEKKHGSRFIDNLKIIVYNMDYFKKLYYNGDKEKYKHLLMLDLTGNELKKLCEGDDIMEKFQKNARALNKNEDVVNFLTAEEEDEILKNTFKSEGYDEGLAKGEAKGKAKGKKESTLEIAKNLLNLNIDINDIVKATGLSKAKIESLK